MVSARRHLHLCVICLLSLLYCDICYSVVGKLSDEIMAEEIRARSKPASIENIKQDSPSNQVQKVKKYISKKNSDQVLVKKNGKFVPNKFNPYIANLYKETDDQAKKLDAVDKVGMDLALKQLAAEFEKQILTLLLNRMFEASGVKHAQGFGAEMWNSELTASIIEAGYREGQIYDDVLEELRENALEQDKRILDDPNQRR